MTESRPNPDKLLDRVKAEEAREGHGQLKVFFGFAPGVGKTYAMLHEAQVKRAEGVDVLAGVVETHKRADTEAMLHELEILPRRNIPYQGVTLHEFDLDAALSRRPTLILVDELAHTNAPGSRHAKRWQDVEELLRAGIDVYATLNVQHLESLNDVVAQITGVTVRETVPDFMLERADELELVDLSPEELLERLEEGKVYVPEMAGRAIENFFRKGNLIALRELSLRKTADSVDAQMRAYKREQAIKTVWPTKERLLVCVGPSPFSPRLVRATRRMAEGLRAEWIALSIETPSTANLNAEGKERIAQTLRLATQLGGQADTITGTRAVDAILGYARDHNVTKIVVGKPVRRRFKESLLGSLVDQLIWRCGDIDVYVITGEGGEFRPVRAHEEEKTQTSRKEYGWATLVIATCTAVAWAMFPYFAPTNLIMIYLIGVALVSAWFGRGPSIFASCLSVALFDFCFVPPYFTFVVDDTQYIFTFGVMLGVGLLISSLTSRIRNQAENARERERRTASLYEMSRKMAASSTLREALGEAVEQISRVFKSNVAVFLPKGETGELAIAASSAPAELGEQELSVAHWVLSGGQNAGRGTDTLPGAKGLYLPLRVTERVLGVLRIETTESARTLDPERLRYVEAFAGQVAFAVERENLSQQAQASEVRVEAERMRNALLSSVSHDLRTPLTVILGSASGLLERDAGADAETRKELAQTIHDEAERLDRLVRNLLEMTRLETGADKLTKEWHVLEEIVGTSVGHVEYHLRNHSLSLSFPEDLPLVHVDALLMEQVFINLIENAIKYTPTGTPIEISARVEGPQLQVEMADRGPGIPPGEEKHIFEKFHQAQSETSRRGVGLGLTICRAIIEAHGGEIKAANREGGGAIFSFTLPLDKQPPTVEVQEESEPHEFAKTSDIAR